MESFLGRARGVVGELAERAERKISTYVEALDQEPSWFNASEPCHPGEAAADAGAAQRRDKSGATCSPEGGGLEHLVAQAGSRLAPVLGRAWDRVADLTETADEGLSEFVRLVGRQVDLPPWLAGDWSEDGSPAARSPSPPAPAGDRGAGREWPPKGPRPPAPAPRPPEPAPGPPPVPAAPLPAWGAFAMGDRVRIWSNSAGGWVEDGVVKDVAARSFEAAGVTVSAGSVLVYYSGGSSCKWVPSASQGEVLQRARPTVPEDARAPSLADGAGAAKLLAVGQAAKLPPADVAKAPAPAGGDDAGASAGGRGRGFGSQLVAGSSEVEAELRSLELACHLEGRRFEDADFKPAMAGRVNRWSRPRELGYHDGKTLVGFEDWRIFRGEPSAEDVCQGELGDCWLLSSLAALAEFRRGRFLAALLPGQTKCNAAGAYIVRLCLGGRWRDITVDDRLPAMGGLGYLTQLAYCSTARQQLWASLIEKAFAKAAGSFAALSGGESQEALSMLTGWPCTVIRFSREDFDPDILWATLCTSRDAGFLMTCSSRSSADTGAESVGLVPNHAYSLINTHVVSRAGASVRLLEIRNPHAKSKWRGAWSEGSDTWTPALRQQVGFVGEKKSGLFFISLDDFLHFFEACTICRIRSESWHETRALVQLPADGGPPCFGMLLEVFDTTECSLSMTQPEERVRKGPFCDPALGSTACVGFAVLRLGPDVDRSGDAVAIAHMRCRATVSTDCWLQAGSMYLVVPLSLHEGRLPVPVVFACVSSRLVVVSRRGLSRSAAKSAWVAYARAGAKGDAKDFHGGKLHLARASGGAIVGLAENRSASQHYRVELSFESEGLRYTRGAAGSADWLAPGQGQIVQICVPDRCPGGSTGWKSSQAYEMRHVWRPPKPLHSPELPSSDADDLHTPFRLS